MTNQANFNACFTQLFKLLYTVITPSLTRGWSLVCELLPEITLLISIIFLIKITALELGAGRPKKALAMENLVAAGYAVTPLVLFYTITIFSIDVTASLNGYFLSTPAIAAAKILIILSGFFVVSISYDYLLQGIRHKLELPIIFLLSLLFLLCLVSVNNLMLLFFTLGGFSITLYVLILFDLQTRTTREAAIKYFYLSAMSAGFVVYGSLLIYCCAGTAYFTDLQWVLPELIVENYGTLGGGVLLIVTGLLFKLSSFPTHLWAVEVYEGSPTPVLAFFLLSTKIAVLVAFVRLLNAALIGLFSLWSPYIAFCCVGSLLWGAFSALYERKIVRFLGYASINQMGYLLLGVISDTDVALRSMFIYLALYALTSAGLLFIYLRTFRKTNLPIIYISDLRGLAVTERALSWRLAIVLFSFVGVPPLTGFHAKYVILEAITQKSLFILSAFGIGLGLLGAFYYLQYVATTQFEERYRLLPARGVLCHEARTAIAGIESLLWLIPAFSPMLLPVCKEIATTFAVTGFIYT